MKRFFLFLLLSFHAGLCQADPKTENQPVNDKNKVVNAKAKLMVSKDLPEDAQGRFKRIKIFETDFKYPLIRVEETIVRDPATGKEKVANQSEMVADHIIIRLKEGVEEKTLQELNQKHRATILKKTMTPNGYIITFDGKDPEALPRILSAYNEAKSIIVYAEANHIAYVMKKME